MGGGRGDEDTSNSIIRPNGGNNIRPNDDTVGSNDRLFNDDNIGSNASDGSSQIEMESRASRWQPHDDDDAVGLIGASVAAAAHDAAAADAADDDDAALPVHDRMSSPRNLRIVGFVW